MACNLKAKPPESAKTKRPEVLNAYTYGRWVALPINSALGKLIPEEEGKREALIDRTALIMEGLPRDDQGQVSLEKLLKGKFEIPPILNSQYLAEALAYAIQRSIGSQRVQYLVEHDLLVQFFMDLNMGLSCLQDMFNFLLQYGRESVFKQNKEGEYVVYKYQGRQSGGIRVSGDVPTTLPELSKNADKIYWVFKSYMDGVAGQWNPAKYISNCLAKLLFNSEALDLTNVIRRDIGYQSGICLNAVVSHSSSPPENIGTDMLTLRTSRSNPVEQLFVFCDGGVRCFAIDYEIERVAHFEIGYDGQDIILFEVIPQEYIPSEN